jgi:hypothetical protein
MPEPTAYTTSVCPDLWTMSFTTYREPGQIYGNCSGEIHGGPPIIEMGVVYSYTNTVPTLADSKQAMPASALTNNIILITLSNLKAGKTYYAQAYATNSVGTGYGGVLSAKA